MKFGELMQVFAGWRVRVTTLDDQGEVATEEISLAETVNAHLRLARYSEAAVVRFTTGTMEFEGQKYPALEVTVRV